MAYENPKLHVVGALAGADLSAEQHTFMIADTTARQFVQQTTAGAQVDGVLQDKPDAAGKPASIAMAGMSKLTAGATVAPGDIVASDTTGRGVTATTGDYGAAKCVEGADADELMTVILHGYGYQP